eukprot:GFUD01023204.1.p1 GENE.GFUD01023204.1~~GFUD01023204.1.p1  ORF type:complete len:274 (+),score=65.02 GFUD01023204.1:51-872(+)
MAARKLSRCLDPNSQPPPTDVSFLFKDDGILVKEIKAHKMILAIASDVFNREFYGSMAEDEIEIKDASQEVFQKFIEFIYNKPLTWKDYDLSFLSSLYYLAEKYNVEDLKDEIIASIPEHDVTKQNVLDIAILAEDHNHHQPLSEGLYDEVASFVMKEFKGKFHRIVEFFTEPEENEKHALVIFKIFKRLKISRCENCKQSPCMNGQSVSLGNFVPGANVTARQGEGDYSKIKKLVGIQTATCFIGSFENGSVLSRYCSLNQVNPPYYVYNCS